MKSIFFYIAFLCTAFVFGCHENPSTAPPSNISVTSVRSRIQGTWRKYIFSSKPSFVAFDTTQNRFMLQFDYDYNFTRELPGNFTLEDSLLTLNLDMGASYSFICSFNEDSLILENIPAANKFGSYVRVSSTPALDGWSTKIYPTSQYVFPNHLIWNLGIGDSGLVAVTYPWNDPTRYLLKIDTTLGTISSFIANDILALDVRGNFIWAATDSSIQKRNLSGYSVMHSFAWRSSLPILFDHYSPTGIAVDDNSIYLMIVNVPIFDGYLIKFTLTGTFISATRTSSIVKDLCIVNGRLFCAEGGDAFWELDPNSGMAINYYTISGQPSFAHIGGIAFSNGHMYITNDWSDLIVYGFDFSTISKSSQPANPPLNRTAFSERHLSNYKAVFTKPSSYLK